MKTQNKIYLDRLAGNSGKPQSYLFYGPAGSGKEDALYYFVLKVAGKEDDADFLEKIKAGLHPDVISIEPETVEGKNGHVREKEISVAKVREAQNKLKFFPYELKQKFCVIKKAQRLNAEAGNALLKILEEPAKETFFILLANSIDSILPTIISRCAPMRFYRRNYALEKEENRMLLRKAFAAKLPEKFDLAEKASKNRIDAIVMLNDWEIAAGEALGKVVCERKQNQTLEVAKLIGNIRKTIRVLESSSSNARTALENLMLEFRQ